MQLLTNSNKAEQTTTTFIKADFTAISSNQLNIYLSISFWTSSMCSIASCCSFSVKKDFKKWLMTKITASNHIQKSKHICDAQLYNRGLRSSFTAITQNSSTTWNPIAALFTIFFSCPFFFKIRRNYTVVNGAIVPRVPRWTLTRRNRRLGATWAANSCSSSNSDLCRFLGAAADKAAWFKCGTSDSTQPRYRESRAGSSWPDVVFSNRTLPALLCPKIITTQLHRNTWYRHKFWPPIEHNVVG